MSEFYVDTLAILLAHMHNDECTQDDLDVVSDYISEHWRTIIVMLREAEAIRARKP